MNMYKLKIMLLSCICILFCGCLKQSSTTKSINSFKNYFLAYRGADHNGALNTPDQTILKYFYSDAYGPFDMRYEIYPPADQVYNQGLGNITDAVKKIASELSSDSTLILHIEAHGSKDGECKINDKPLDSLLNPKHIVSSLEEGLSSNTKLKEKPKRFILWSTSCFSGQFLNKLETAINNKSFFKEAIYIISSDAARVTYNYTGDTIAMLLLRTLQRRRCNSKNEYDKDYELAYKDVHDYLILKGYANNSKIEYFTKCFTPYDGATPVAYRSDLPVFNDNPTFADYQKVIDIFKVCLKKEFGVAEQNYTKHISYSDNSIENSAIFSNACN